MLPDRQSVLFAETWAAGSAAIIRRAQERQVEVVIANLPGYPDNINRASDGNYWLRDRRQRSPALDLALRMPGFRRRMARRSRPTSGCIRTSIPAASSSSTSKGEVLESLWDLGGKNHPMITSMREHKGFSISAASPTIASAPTDSGRRSELVCARYLLGQP